MIKEHRPFILSFGALFIFFFWKLFFMREGFTLHDYSVQHVPWAAAYAAALKEGTLLLWTPLIQCGFPLFAEGQTGMLYPANLLLYRWLPFEAAYNGSVLGHFLLAGISTYAFARKRQLSAEAAAVSALAFTFGSAYAGLLGSSVALRALAWFPASLVLMEDWLGRGKLRTLVLMAFVWAQSFLAGAPQSALYAALFSMAYLFLRAHQTRDRHRLKRCSFAAAALVFAAVTALPQLWASFLAAAHSTRSLQGPGFALWGSVAPWSLATVYFFAFTRVLRFGLYIGIWPVLAALSAVTHRQGRVYLWLGLAALFMSAGIFNPLYWALVKLPVVSMLRNPSKFLFFAAFFFSLLAGAGLDALVRSARPWAQARTALLAATGALAAAFLIAHFGGPALESFGRWYLEHFVTGQSHHRGSHEFYLHKLGDLLRLVRAEVRPGNLMLWLPLAWTLLYFACAGRRRQWAVWIVAADLLVFGVSGYAAGLTGNIGPFPDRRVAAQYPADGRWLDTARGASALFEPNRNMLTGHAQVGAYAPLLDKDYFALTAELGALDDSLGRTTFTDSALTRKRPLIDRMGVRYIASDRPLHAEGLTVLENGPARYIYANTQAGGAFYFADDGASRVLQVTEPGPLEAVARVHTEENGVLIRNSVFDPGWKAWVDGRPVPIERADEAFQSVRLEPGEHEVRFLFRPDYFSKGVFFYAAGLLLMAALLAGCFKNIVII